MGMDDPVRVTIDAAGLAERAVMMATKMEHVRVLRKKQADDRKNTQALIDSELNELEAMARVILEGEEDAKQGDLFADGTLGNVSAELAARGLVEEGLVESAAEVVREELVEAPDLVIGEPVDVGTVDEPKAVRKAKKGKGPLGRKKGGKK